MPRITLLLKELLGCAPHPTSQAPAITRTHQLVRSKSLPAVGAKQATRGYARRSHNCDTVVFFPSCTGCYSPGEGSVSQSLLSSCPSSTNKTLLQKDTWGKRCRQHSKLVEPKNWFCLQLNIVCSCRIIGSFKSVCASSAGIPQVSL